MSQNVCGNESERVRKRDVASTRLTEGIPEAKGSQQAFNMIELPMARATARQTA